MSALKKNPTSVGVGNGYRSAAPATVQPRQFSGEEIKEFVEELEVPFKASLIEWRVTRTNEEGSRGEIMPYADPRAYTDRLNELFTPAGWTRKYRVTTSASFERSPDQKVVAKVFITCDLTVFGLGSHAATGEEWADNDNAGTSAEAQAFKRACACFGLGRYLYYFGGTWVGLDDRQRPREMPRVHGWATPEGWRKGLRPSTGDESGPEGAVTQPPVKKRSATPGKRRELIGKIEAMADPIGRVMYRGLLKKVAKVWKPGDIHDTGVLKKVLLSMQTAEQGFTRLEAARSKIGPDAMERILGSLKLKSVEQVSNLEALDRLLLAIEEKISQLEAT